MIRSRYVLLNSPHISTRLEVLVRLPSSYEDDGPLGFRLLLGPATDERKVSNLHLLRDFAADLFRIGLSLPLVRGTISTTVTR